MPYILRRPMFRGGVSNTYGTGITTNLEPRKGFENGTEEQMDSQTREAYAKTFGDNIREQMMPSRREQVLDFLRSFGASAAPAGEFQTIGSALGKTGANFESIFSPKVTAARKAGTEGYLSALKGVDKEKLLEYQKLAKDAYRTGMYASEEEALRAVIKEKILGKPPKDDTSELLAYYEKYYTDKENYTEFEAQALAQIAVKTRRDPSFINKIGGENFKGPINFKIFERTATGFKISPTATNSQIPNTNQTFVDPYTNSFFIVNDKKELIPLKIN
jgi:hypothetical protein